MNTVECSACGAIIEYDDGDYDYDIHCPDCDSVMLVLPEHGC